MSRPRRLRGGRGRGKMGRRPQTAKRIWRAQILARVRAMEPAARRAASRRLGASVRRLAAYRQARWIGCYLAVELEVDTWPMVRQALADGKRVAAPVPLPASRTLRLAELTSATRGLVRGPYGIPQPDPRRARRVDPQVLDLLLVPGVAFDRQGHRLGRGGGYFDRFLATLPATVPRIGLAFRCQRVQRLPRARHDQPVTTVLTA